MGKIELGSKFNKLEVIAKAVFHLRKGKKYWICFCDCGKAKEIREDHLLSGRTKSCGCLKVEKNKRNALHSMYGTNTYISYYSMKDRCYNVNSISYTNYGGRGIKVCDRWLNGEDGIHPFLCFLEDMGERPSPKFSIERIDGESDYCPKNCIWADRLTQNRNRRNTISIEYKNVVKTLSEWSTELGVRYSTLRKRLKNRTVEQAFSM